MPDLIVVVDPDFGERLEEVAQLAPTWVVATPGNANAYQRLWKAHAHADHQEKGAITSFRVREAEARVANLLDILPQTEQHHGELRDDYFAYPSGFVLEVIGVTLTDTVTIGLSEFGFSSFAETPGGFQAQV
jgi:hypothetical protein